ncbi:MAG: MFS transporter [Micavibrio sp.]|nr:MFS transporter [Micavibrio sp.]
MAVLTTSQIKYSKKSAFSWCLYDWANTAFGTVIITFIYGVYFSKSLVGDEIEGSALWGYAIAGSGVAIALLAPFLGAVADHAGSRKKWIAFFSALCIVATSLLWFSENPDGSKNIVLILILVAIANLGLELGQVFYNAMLPNIAPPHMKGRLSGWAWALGYMGGLASLVVCLFVFVGLGDIAPIFELSKEKNEHIRIVGPFIALWFLVFMLPLFLFVKDQAADEEALPSAVRDGWKQLIDSFHHIKEFKSLFLFLIASAIYRDGLVTLFALGGVYAAGQFGMNFTEILIFAIGLNVAAGLGAFGFAFLDDAIGSKKTIIYSLVGLIVVGGIILLTSDKYVFIGLSMVLGIFMGPVQAASRTMVARLSPPHILTQAYGFYAFTGKSISFLGPLSFGLATTAFATQQAGMATIVLFWVVGFVMLWWVKEKDLSNA